MRLCRHFFLLNLKWIRPISAAKNGDTSYTSAARVRPVFVLRYSTLCNSLYDK